MTTTTMTTTTTPSAGLAGFAGLVHGRRVAVRSGCTLYVVAEPVSCVDGDDDASGACSETAGFDDRLYYVWRARSV